jgi:hypothetical protein
MLSSSEEATQLLNKWLSEHTPVVVGISVRGEFSLRFKGLVTEAYPIVRIVDGDTNFVVDLRAAVRFEYSEAREARSEFREILEDEYACLFFIRMPSADIFFGECK